MPNTSLVISGTVNGRDAAAVTSGTVTVYNFTKSNETTSVKIDSSGQYAIDLGALSTQWAVNDIIYIVAKSGQYSGVLRWKISAVDSAFVQNIFLKPFSFEKHSGQTLFVTFIGAAVGGTAHDFQLIERATDKVVATLKCAANGSDRYAFGYPGIPLSGGYYLLRTATSAAATGSTSNQTEGSASIIGDTTTNALIFTTVVEGG